MAPLQSLIADARSTAHACIASLAAWAASLVLAVSATGQGGAPEAPDPAAEAAGGAEAEGEAPAPPKLVLGVPLKFAVTPAVEKAVHDIDEVLQWFLSARASHRLSPSHDQPSVHRQRDRFHRALDQLSAEARRHPAMLEAAREHEGIDRHAKLMLIGLDRAEHLDEYAWVMEELPPGTFMEPEEE